MQNYLIRLRFIILNKSQLIISIYFHFLIWFIFCIFDATFTTLPPPDFILNFFAFHFIRCSFFSFFLRDLSFRMAALASSSEVKVTVFSSLLVVLLIAYKEMNRSKRKLENERSKEAYQQRSRIVGSEKTKKDGGNKTETKKYSKKNHTIIF